MSFKIQPQEFHVNRDSPSIRTKVPREALEDGKLILERVRNANLSCGDHILVQCLNADSTEVLCEAEFVVVSCKTNVVREEKSDYDIRTFEATTYQVIRKGDWWVTPAGEAAQKDALAEVAEKPKGKKAA
jgi:hypothetical protein